MRFVSTLVLSLIVGLTLVLGGCAHAAKSAPRPLSVAVAVTPLGAGTVSAGQVAQIHQALRPEFERTGYIFANSRKNADLVLTVSFIPNPGGQGGRISFTSLEPTEQFREATDGGETPEAKEFRRRAQDLQAIVEAKGRNPDSH